MEKPKTIMYKTQKIPESKFSWKEIKDCEIVIRQGENKVVLNKSDLTDLEKLLQAQFRST